jgi:hypothetical protein
MRCAILIAIATLFGAAESARALTPTPIWSQWFGSSGSQVGTVVATTTTSVYVGGNFDGSINLGGSTHNSAGGTDLFLARFDTSGNLVWSLAFGSSSTQGLQGMAVDASGDVYISGQFQNTLNFGGGLLTSAGSFDTYLAKFSVAGAHQWSKSFGDAGLNQTPAGLAADNSNNVYLLGYFDGAMNFGGGALTSAGGFDIYLAKFNSAGTHQWSKRFGDADYQYPESVNVTTAGVVVVTGYFRGAVDFGGGNLASAGDVDVFLARFDTAGGHQWSKRFGSAGAQYGYDVDVDTGGNVFVFGSFAGDIDLGGGTLTSESQLDLFVGKFGSTGTHLWSRRLGGPDDQWARAIEYYGSDIYLTGYFEGGVNFGGEDLLNESTSNDDMFLARLDYLTGDHRWSARYGTRLADDRGLDLSVSNNHVHATGSFEDRLDFGFGDDLVSGTQSADVFLARFFRETTEPVISSITDIGNDQGGQVRIRFGRSGFDQATTPVPITGYEIYLRDDPLPSAAPARDGAAEAWLLMQQVPPYTFAFYATVAPTLADSTVANGGHLSAFKVRAVTANPSVYFDGPVLHGYSLDNLAPGLPENLLLAGGVLSWRAPAGGDVAHYTVYGSAARVFDERAVVLDHATATRFELAGHDYEHYFVTATDAAGNEGPAAAVGGGVPGGSTAHVLSLSAFPNPFNPATTVRYTLPSAGRVTVDVFDARGARVVALVDREQSAGAYTARWDGRDERGEPAGSGVYFARVSHAGATRSYKLVLLK